MEKRVSVNQIVSIQLVLEREHPFYVWKDKVSFLGITLTAAGFYYTFVFEDTIKTEDQIKAKGNLVINDQKVFYKPHLAFRMSNGDTLYKYFESKDTALEFYQYFSFNSLTLIDNN